MENHYFEVQTETLCDGWENCWTETNENEEGKPWVFETYQDAEDELFDFITEINKQGMGYLLNEYRIREVLHGQTHALFNF